MKMNVTIRIEEKERKRMQESYGTHTSGLQRAGEGWLTVRNYTLNEIKGIFQGNELKFLVSSVNGLIFQPEFAANKQMMLIRLDDIERYESMQINAFEINLAELKNKIEKLSSAQIFFLNEFCHLFWENAGDLDEYVKGLL